MEFDVVVDLDQFCLDNFFCLLTFTLSYFDQLVRQLQIVVFPVLAYIQIHLLIFIDRVRITRLPEISLSILLWFWLVLQKNNSITIQSLLNQSSKICQSFLFTHSFLNYLLQKRTNISIQQWIFNEILLQKYAYLYQCLNVLMVFNTLAD